MRNSLILCHTGSFEDHFLKNVFLNIERKYFIENFTRYTLDILPSKIFKQDSYVKNRYYQADAWSESFISKHENEFDIVFAPDCAGIWFSLQDTNTLDKKAIKNMMEKMLRLVSYDGYLIYGKVLNKNFGLYIQELYPTNTIDSEYGTLYSIKKEKMEYEDFCIDANKNFDLSIIQNISDPKALKYIVDNYDIPSNKTKLFFRLLKNYFYGKYEEPRTKVLFYASRPNKKVRVILDSGHKEVNSFINIDTMNSISFKHIILEDSTVYDNDKVLSKIHTSSLENKYNTPAFFSEQIKNFKLFGFLNYLEKWKNILENYLNTDICSDCEDMRNYALDLITQLLSEKKDIEQKHIQSCINILIVFSNICKLYIGDEKVVNSIIVAKNVERLELYKIYFKTRYFNVKMNNLVISNFLVKTQKFESYLNYTLQNYFKDIKYQIIGSFSRSREGEFVTDIDVDINLDYSHPNFDMFKILYNPQYSDILFFSGMRCGEDEYFKYPWKIDYSTLTFSYENLEDWLQKIRLKIDSFDYNKIYRLCRNNDLNLDLTLTSIIAIQDIIRKYSRLKWSLEDIKNKFKLGVDGTRYEMLDCIKKYVPITEFLFVYNDTYCIVDCGIIDKKYRDVYRENNPRNFSNDIKIFEKNWYAVFKYFRMILPHIMKYKFYELKKKYSKHIVLYYIANILCKDESRKNIKIWNDMYETLSKELKVIFSGINQNVNICEISDKIKVEINVIFKNEIFRNLIQYVSEKERMNLINLSNRVLMEESRNTR